ncbi:MAG: ATP-binding protein [Clostridia bacterium]|nr:ATP-binding protein [Clostridia bacterium]
MRELSLNILDIAQNSVRANATEVDITVNCYRSLDLLEISIKDNGCGMSEEMVKSVIDPFTTTRTTRKVGMGIPLFKHSCESTGGSFEIKSKLAEGTTTCARYVLSSIDRMPLGDLAGSIQILYTASANINFRLFINTDDNNYEFSTAEACEILGVNDLMDADISYAVYGILKDNIIELLKGV